MDDVYRLLAGGASFAPKTRMAAVMKAVRDEICESIQEAIDKDGYVEIVLHTGERVRYTFDLSTSNWQRTI